MHSNSATHKGPDQRLDRWPENAGIDKTNLFFMIFVPAMAVITTALYFYFEKFNPWMIPLFFFFYFATGLSITVGYHRLFAHKGYEAHPLVQLFCLIFGAAAFQNSALKWCTDHRVHHLHVDGDDDPYNIQRGFWYAHVGWVCRTGNPKDFSHLGRDLAANPLVRWQDKHYALLGLVFGFGLPTLIGWMMGSALGGLALGGFLRLTMVHHFTFFINSLCHYWGKQTYTDRNSAKDNYFLAFFTYGEGFHNFHHLFANDYRNGIHWYDFDPSKWTIRTLAFFGFAKNLRVTPEIQILRARLQMNKKRLESRIADRSLLQSWSPRLDQIRLKAEHAYARMGELKRHYKLEYKTFKEEKSAAGRAKIAQIKAEIRQARLEYKEALAQWRNCTSALLKAA